MIIDDFSKPKLTIVEGSAANDYFTRRKSEEERIAGTRAPAKNKKNPANTDYAKKRKQQDVEESAPPGDKAERMVKHIKAGYAKDGKLTPKEKGIAFATAWKAHNAGKVEESDRPFRGTGGRFNRGDDERHDLDPTDWYIVKDGKMFAASIYPRQVQQAIAQGFSRTKQEARARASSQGVTENYPKHQDLSGISTEKLKAYLAKQSQQQVSGEGNQVKRVRAELQSREQGVAEGSGDAASATPAKNERGKYTAWDDDEPMRLKCEDGEFRTIQEINMLRQKIGMKPFSIKSQQGVAEGSKEKTQGIALSKAYKKDFDDKKPGHTKPETALTGTYSKTGKPGGDLKKQGVAEGSESGPVEAYGYRYNNRDQRIVWRKIFPSGEAAYAWADRNNATVLGTRSTEQSLKENAEDLHIGDPVIITGNGIEFEGATGEIIDFGQQHRFVVVDLYNHGKHSFHSSDVSFNEYAGSDDEEARMYDAGEFGDDYRDEMDEARMSAAQRLSNAWDKQRAKSDASLRRTPSSIPKTVDKERMIRDIATSDASPEHKKVAIDAVMKTMGESRVQRQQLLAQMLNSR